MSVKMKKVLCIDCGKLVVKSALNRSHRCSKCAYKKMVQSNKEMHNKRGESWERWKVGMGAYLDRLKKGSEVKNKCLRK